MREYKRRRYISITKYNPFYRDENGAYIKDEWTSYLDIGKKFNDTVFTLKDYLEVETKYIKAFFEVTSFFETRRIKVTHIAKDPEISQLRIENERELLLTLSKVEMGDLIEEKTTLENLIKLALRKHIFELELLVDRRSNSEILFGFDYYMYLKTNKDVELLRKQINKIGLYTRE